MIYKKLQNHKFLAMKVPVPHDRKHFRLILWRKNKKRAEVRPLFYYGDNSQTPRSCQAAKSSACSYRLDADGLVS